MMLRKTCWKALGVSVLVLAGILAGSSGRRGVSAGEEGDMVIVVGTDDIPMEDFLRAVSKACDVPLIWNPRDKNIRGKKIIGSVDLRAPREKLFEIVRSLLTFYELVMTPVGPPDHQLVLVMDARQTSNIVRLKPEYVTLTDENLGAFEFCDGRYITATIRVEHMQDLRSARNALTRVVTGQNIGGVIEAPAARAFLITDFAPNVVRAYRIIKELDAGAASADRIQVEALIPEHRVAADVRPVLIDLVGPKGPRITADSVSNKLVVLGTRAQIEQVQRAFAAIDVPDCYADAPEARFVRLQHVSAEVAAAALSELTKASPDLWSNVPSRGDPAPTFVAFEPRNGILIAATSAQFSTIQALIEKIDVEGD